MMQSVPCDFAREVGCVYVATPSTYDRPVPSAAGSSVSVALVRQLADLVDERTAIELNRSLDAGQTGISLTEDAREKIARALEDCSYGLSDLRDVVAVERTARKRDGSR